MTKVLVLAALVFAATASGGTAASPVRAPLLGVVPHTGAAHGLDAAAALTGSGPLVLQTQPCTPSSSPTPCWTMRTDTTYAIYWVPSGFSVGANYESDINQYLADVAAASGSLTNVYSVATQYYDDEAAIHYASTFGGAYVDTDPFPASGCTATAVCLTDDQLQQEIQNVLTTKGWQPGPDTLFLIMTPSGVDSCFDGTNNQCTTNSYCAYHSGFLDSSSSAPVLYANEPYDGAISGCHSRPGQGSPNDPDADATINTISHEQNEAITDPWGDAWFSNDVNEDEMADLCSWDFGSPLGTATNGQPYNQVINGHEYSLQMEYSNDSSGCLQRYTPTIAPSTVAPPALTGPAGEGKVLSTSEGSWMHAPSAYAYQWQRCAAAGTGCTDIAGATATTYQLAASDLQHVVRVEVTAGNVAGTSATVASATTAVVVPPPSVQAPPVLSGTAAASKRLSTTTGTWNAQATFTYHWLRCAADGTGCTTIPGVAAKTRLLVAADAGHTIEASVTATNAAGTASALSKHSGVIVAVPGVRKAPHISGRAQVGGRLSADQGSWRGPPKGYRYQWLRCNARGGSCVSIRHATHATYRLAQFDAGHQLRVRVTAVNAAGSRVATSRATARVPARR